MSIIFGLAIVVIVCMVGAIALNVYFNKPIEKKYLWIALGLFVIALSVVAYCTAPAESDDLFRHFKEIDRMKTNGFDYVKEAAVYRMNPIINYMFYFISLVNNKYLLPFITVLVIYGTHLAITVRIYEKLKISSRILCLYILLFFALVPIRFSISNIRIIMAFAIVFAAIYRDYFKDNRNLITLCLYIVPLLIHSSTIIILGLRLLDIKIFRFYKVRFVLLFWTLFSSGLASYLIKMKSLFFRDLGNRLNIYMSSEYGMDTRLFIVQVVFLIAIYALNSLIIKESKKSSKDYMRRYIEFVQIVILFTLGSFLSRVLYMRMGYFVAFLILPTIAFGYDILKDKIKSGKFLVIVPCVIIILGLLAHQAVNAKVYWRLWI